MCARSDQSCCSLAPTTTQPGVAAFRARASRVALCFSFDQNMPRAPHGAPVLEPQRENFGPPDHLRQNFDKTGALIRGARSRSGCARALAVYKYKPPPPKTNKAELPWGVPFFFLAEEAYTQQDSNSNKGARTAAASTPLRPRARL
jgi:hypothetical protein